MRASTVRGLLIAPVFLYAAVLDFTRFGGWDPSVALVVLVMALPLLELVLPRAEGRLFVPAWALAMIAGIGLLQARGAPAGGWAIVGSGVLLGAPITILAGLLLWRDSAYATVLGVAASLGALLALLAGGSQAVAGGATPGAAMWIVAFSQVCTAQYEALGTWVSTGGLTNPTPFGAISDPVFLGLGLLAVLAVVLALLERPEGSGEGPEPTDPLFPRSSGIAPLVVAALAGLAFEWAVAVEPRYALLGTVVGIIATLAALGVLGWVSRRPSRGGRPGPKEPRPARA
jgi:hypothetical protein